MKHHLQNRREDKDKDKDISPLKEKLLLILVAILVVVLTNLSFIFGLKMTPDKMQFLGRRSVNPVDTYPQLALIEQGRTGQMLFSNLYDISTRSAYIVSPVNLALGQIAGKTNLPNIMIFHLGRIVLGAILLCIIYHLLRLFFSKRKEILFAFVFLSLSSGLGLFLFKLFLSYDLFLPASNIFLSLMDSPELIFQEILLVLFLIGIVRIWQTRKLNFSNILLILTSGGILIPNLFYNYPRFLIVPELLPLLISIGFCLPVLFVAHKKIEGFHQSLLLALFFGLLFFLPIPFRFLYFFGFFLFISICGVKAYLYLYDQKLYPLFSKRKIVRFLSRILTFMTIFFLFPATNYFHLYWDMMNFKKDSPDAYFHYLLKDEIAGINWLKENTLPESIVLAKPFYGNIIAGATGRREFLGDEAYTPFFTEKIRDIDGFLNSWPDINKIDYLSRNKINYLYFGKNDSMLKGTFQPESVDYLEKAFEKDGITVYEFTQRDDSIATQSSILKDKSATNSASSAK